VDTLTESLFASGLLAFDAAAYAENALHILYAALGLGLVIFFHELGHFAVAKWCGVFVERFSIGFGPILWSFKRGDTEYALSLVPFGGYVKMLGQDDMDPSQLSSEEIAEDPRSYSAKTVGQRMAIISAGVIMNIGTGILFFAFAFRGGIDASPPTVGHVVVGKPGWSEGIATGDTITRINGHGVRSFRDILRFTTLSRGELQIEGIRADKSTFQVNLEPNREKLRRMIGIGPAFSTEIAPIDQKTDEPAIVPGSPSDGKFLSNDRIVAVNGTPVESHSQLKELLSRHRAKPVTLTLNRADKEIPVDIDPWKFRDLGIWMDIEQITALQKNSPAEQAGLRVGDKIIKVNGQDVGRELNPLHLPEVFEGLAGTDVAVTVLRIGEDSPEPREVGVTVTPTDAAAWINPPESPDSPLAIPGIGVAYHLTSTIVKVVAGSPAANAGISEKFSLKSIQLQTDNEVWHRMTGHAKPATIQLDDPRQRNMAYALWQLQDIPDVKVTLTFQSTDVEPTELQPASDPDGHCLPKRGYFPMTASIEVKADAMPEALAMAVDETRNNAIDIYLTIRNLITGDLSAMNLQGPVGIAKVAYAVSQQGIERLLMFLGFLSINLAVLNFLPIPVLDGGHMVFLIWEAVTRKRPSERVLAAATYCGMAFVLGLMLFVIYLDIFFHPGVQ
jgi:regulator of sigma E protease